MAEYDLIARFRERIGEPPEGEVWSGDDAALVAAGSDRVLFTTDSMVEGVDFDFAYCEPGDVGFKAIAINVSDIAAMGGRPGAAVATLAFPASTAVDVVDSLLDGLLEAADKWSVRIVGGDLSRAGEMSLGIALLGVPPPDGPLRRDGARPGEVIAVTGTPGLAGVGLSLLRRDGAHARAEAAARAQLRPTARIGEGSALAAVGATAAIDVSDGLAIDLYRMCRASGVGCEVSTSELIDALEPIVPAETATKEAVLLGGEDFELLFAVPEDRFEDARTAVVALGTRCTKLGYVTGSDMIVDEDPLDEWKDRSWDHLSNP